MKKFLILIATAALISSCGVSMPAPVPTAKPTPKLISSSTHSKVSVAQPVVAVFADLDVSPKKISFFYLPSKTVISGGLDNVIDSAVREALASNGDADVLVGMETQIKYNAEGDPESITVTGYPAKYVNFRNPGDDYLRKLGTPTSTPTPVTSENSGGALPFKLGK